MRGLPVGDVSDSRYNYILEGADGSTRSVDKREAMRYPLRARDGEPSWSCACCAANGWSWERARLCAECGMPTPLDERRAEQMKQQKRKEMADDRKSTLGGRRITTLQRDGRCKRKRGAYEPAPGDDAAVEEELSAQSPSHSASDAKRLSCVLWLDSAVSALTLGQQGIVRPALRQHLQPAAVATALVLAPRMVGDASCRGAASEAAGTNSDAAARADLAESSDDDDSDSGSSYSTDDESDDDEHVAPGAPAEVKPPRA